MSAIPFLDIAIPSEVVHGVKVFGLSGDAIAFFLNKYPTLRAAISGRAVTFDELIEKCPSAISEILAAGAGHFGDFDAIAAAANVPLDMQADFFTAIVRRTMPEGIGPFVEKINGLAGALEGGASTKQPSTTLRRRLRNSSPPDTAA